MKVIILDMVNGQRQEGINVVETTMPIVINNPEANVRSWAPRKYGKAGTRLVLHSGTAYGVTNSFADVHKMITGEELSEEVVAAALRAAPVTPQVVPNMGGEQEGTAFPGLNGDEGPEPGQ